MKDTLSSLDNIVTKHQKRVNLWLDKLTFFYILCLWIGIIILFGLAYYLLDGNFSHLLYANSQSRVSNLFDHIYFSFITATSTGFGDILPKGGHKIISIVEVVFGLILLAFVTSKFIAIKQNVILTEMYELSLHERINRIRSSLLLFRQKINLLTQTLEEKSLSRRELEELVFYVTSLEDTLHDTLILLQRRQKSEYTSSIGSVDLELIFHSIHQSLERLYDIIKLLNANNTEWRKENLIKAITRSLNLNSNLLGQLNQYNLQSLETIRQQNNSLVDKINSEL